MANILPDEYQNDPRWKPEYKLAFESGFCSIEPDGSPHLERPDFTELQAFISLVRERE